jgi:polyribonucleotide nucleotidyltransferase
VLNKTVKELDEIELEEFVAGVEEQANEVEKNLVKIFSIEGTNEFDEIRAKYLNGQTAPIPTFDYEPVQ